MSSFQRIAVVIVSYNTDLESSSLVRQLSNFAEKSDFEVFVCDNSSRFTKAPLLAQLQTDAHFAEQFASFEVLGFDNPGYFGAAQRLFVQKLKNQIQKYEYVLILNSDLEFPNLNFFAELRKLSKLSQLGVVAPSIVSGLSGRDSNPYMMTRPSRRRMHFYKSVFSNSVTCQAYQLAGLLKSKIKLLLPSQRADLATVPIRPLEIYAGHGSCLIFHRNYFEKGLDFFHGTFLYNEEITVAENCRTQSLKLIYAPALHLLHHEHASTGQIYSRRTLNYIRDSSQFVVARYFP